LWKNWVVWRRTPIISPFEILAPIFLMLILVFLRHRIGSEFVESTNLPDVYPLSDGTLGYMTVIHYPLFDSPLMGRFDDELWM